MKKVYAVQRRMRIQLVPVLMLGLVGALAAQQPSKRPSTAADTPTNPQLVQSDLAKDNFDRVGASPAQIKDVLIKDPGLMVELKRWIAKEASDNGQIVSDEDLTDNSVFDRLTTDVRFRSVATRLVQRYGYLRPNVNPDSELGKEQELLVKERVRRLVQIEAQEDTESIKPQNRQPIEAKEVPCDLEDERECANRATDRPRRTLSTPSRNVPQQEPPSNSPNDGQPISSSPRIIQAEGSSDGLQFGGSTDGSISFQSVSIPMKPQRDPSFNENTSPNLLSVSPQDQTRSGMTQGLGAGTSSGGSEPVDELEVRHGFKIHLTSGIKARKGPWTVSWGDGAPSKPIRRYSLPV